jgi:hypothetical protein
MHALVVRSTTVVGPAASIDLISCQASNIPSRCRARSELSVEEARGRMDVFEGFPDNLGLSPEGLVRDEREQEGL